MRLEFSLYTFVHVPLANPLYHLNANGIVVAIPWSRIPRWFNQITSQQMKPWTTSIWFVVLEICAPNLNLMICTFLLFCNILCCSPFSIVISAKAIGLYEDTHQDYLTTTINHFNALLAWTFLPSTWHFHSLYIITSHIVCLCMLVFLLDSFLKMDLYSTLNSLAPSCKCLQRNIHLY